VAEKMKIILCLHHFLPEFVGGTEIYVANLSKQLLRKEIEVVIVIPNLGIDATEEYFYEGIRVIKYAENSIEDRPMILGKKKPDGLKIFSQIVKKEKPALIHFHELAPGRGINLFHVEEVSKLKIPLVITFHVPFYSCMRGTLLYKGQQKCDGEIIIKRCTACIYQQKDITGVKGSVLNKVAMGLFHLKIDSTGLNSSLATALGFPFVIDKMKKDLLRFSFLAEKIVVIADWYKQVLKRNNIPVNKMVFIKQGLPNSLIRKPDKSPFTAPLRVVYIGRITALKGLHLLIEAVRKINSEKIQLDIYGSETKDSYIMTCKEKSKTHENIRWQGRINSSEVIDTLSKYHVLCLPSAFEMSPLVIQEAFAAGLPVLASDVKGNVEQVKNNENGWLFQLDDENDLKNKLESLINNPRMIDKACEKLPSINTFEKVGADHIELYDTVINNYNNH
jgi:glycosyltransferase involved in cell wall biosynthesis